MDQMMEHLIYWEIYPNTIVHHLEERNGKIGAMNRMVFVKHQL
jgi:hypothetical protein